MRDSGPFDVDLRPMRNESACQTIASTQTPHVLIVGAGPGGLFAACELVRHGVRPRIVERRLAPHGEARGTALQPAMLEMLERGGLIEPFLRAGVRIRRLQLLGPGLREIVSENFAEAGCSYDFQCSLPQWRTEAILRDHLDGLGVAVEFGAQQVSGRDGLNSTAGIECHAHAIRIIFDRRQLCAKFHLKALSLIHI